jgi:hypothetical protein
MANNLMYLANKRTGAKVCLAKYYPSTGWYVHAEESLVAKLEEAFDGSKAVPAGMYGGNDWVIEYEQDDVT